MPRIHGGAPLFSVTPAAAVDHSVTPPTWSARARWADMEDDDSSEVAVMRQTELAQKARQAVSCTDVRQLSGFLGHYAQMPPPLESPKLPPGFRPQTLGPAPPVPPVTAPDNQIFACVANVLVPKYAPPSAPALIPSAVFEQSLVHPFAPAAQAFGFASSGFVMPVMQTA